MQIVYIGYKKIFMKTPAFFGDERVANLFPVWYNYKKMKRKVSASVQTADPASFPCGRTQRRSGEAACRPCGHP